MTETVRPRRSALFMPGANERALEKAARLPADTVILDLEDAVAPDSKDTARASIREAVTDGRYGAREVLVRVNARDTPWFHDDVALVAAVEPDGLLVPKVSSADEVTRVEQALEAAGVDDSVRIWAMLETPSAVLDARAIVRATDRLAGVVLGTNDLAKDLRAEHVPGRGPLLPALCWCLLAVREARRVVLDSVYNDVGDLDGFEAECRQGRELGFDGKAVIHPRQLEPCNRVFGPSEDEVAEARTTIAAFEQASAQGRGVANVDGRMVEHLHAEQARELLARADAIAQLHG